MLTLKWQPEQDSKGGSETELREKKIKERMTSQNQRKKKVEECLKKERAAWLAWLRGRASI